MTKPSKNLTIGLSAALVLVVVVAAILQATNVIHLFNKGAATVYHKKAATAGQNTKGETTVSAQASNSSSVPPSSYSQDKNATTAAALISPSGNFVNNHHPSLSGSSGSNQMFSVCNTTAGASCNIAFTNTTSGLTKALSAQTTDSSGAAYWSWTLQQAGLTQGTWKIVATATLQNQSKSVSDAMNLEVGP